jgi:hypothetical protein
VGDCVERDAAVHRQGTVAQVADRDQGVAVVVVHGRIGRRVAIEVGDQHAGGTAVHDERSGRLEDEVAEIAVEPQLAGVAADGDIEPAVAVEVGERHRPDPVPAKGRAPRQGAAQLRIRRWVRIRAGAMAPKPRRPQPLANASTNHQTMHRGSATPFARFQVLLVAVTAPFTCSSGRRRVRCGDA